MQSDQEITEMKVKMNNMKMKMDKMEVEMNKMKMNEEPLTMTMLAAAVPQDQKQMFPRLYPDLAGKVTGILLEK